MKKVNMDSLFKSGIWIKEQQGRLTIGSLDENDENIMIIPEKLSSKIIEFENDMIEALYGDKSVHFNPTVIDIKKLLANIEKQFKGNDIRISFFETKDNFFKGDYNEIYALMEKFVLSSLSGFSKNKKPPLIYINASILQDHLCIIYRDSDSISDPSKLRDEIDFIKTVLKGEITYKATSGDNSYYDIMIPSKE